MEKMKPQIKLGKEGAKHYLCPKCEKRITSTKNFRQEGRKCNYCPDCGQKLDWGEIVLETYWPQ